jgi:D-alanine-D-alanine ligase-like ATP-grasp enzyme
VLTPEQARAGQGLPAAGLYVEAIDKGREYRVHVGKTPSGAIRVIDVTRKIRRPEATGERGFVWNHDNGFMFVRDGVNLSSIPSDLLQQASRAISALGLTFGAVDIVVPRRGRRSIREMPSYVLEVNTAPGMEGITVERYALFFETYYTDNGEGIFPSWEGDTSTTSNNDD